MLLPMVLQYATEKFKYDDEGRISPEDKDIDATNEVDIIFNEKICKKFKSDDEVQISAEDKDIDAEVDIFFNEVNISTESKDAEATVEVYIFFENRTNFERELLGS